MRIIKGFVLTFMLILASNVFAQTIIKGIVVNNKQESLLGVEVTTEDLTVGAKTNVMGKFKLILPNGKHKLIFSIVGYTQLSKEIYANGKTLDLGHITLSDDIIGLKEISVLASLAVDRKTPVAASTIKPQYITEKLGTQDFSGLLRSTPGVYVSKGGGSFGDSRINIRGFAANNVAVTVNGVPVNDMENGWVYWSDWIGLPDATRIIQVQRGLGASKLALPSVGGTVNILTRTTDAKRGAEVFSYFGNDSYQKYGFTLSSGKTKNDWASTLSLSTTKGDGYVDATNFKAYSYFFSLSKRINEDHLLSFSVTGTPQRYNQRRNEIAYGDIRNSDSGIRFNNSWGYYKGKLLNTDKCFYHKSQAFLTHYWTVNRNLFVSNVLYGSIGNGGVTGIYGDQTKFSYRKNGLIDFGRIEVENIANGEAGSSSILAAWISNHFWYGLLSSAKYEIDKLTLTAGVDARFYKGEHYREVTDLLGGDYFIDNNDINNPNKKAEVDDKVAYNNNGLVSWGGVFASAEYELNDLTAFVSLAVSSKGYKRIDYFNYLDSDSNQETDWEKFTGYSTKAGVNYNINENQNVFVNAGYFERQPDFGAIYVNYVNHLNKNAENERITSFELGYGFKTDFVNVKLNAYHTRWMDKTFIRSYADMNGNYYTANILGVDAIHQGLELEFLSQITDKLIISSMFSYGDWKNGNDITGAKVFDNEQNQIAEVNLKIKDTRVGDAAQTMAAIGIDYEILKGFKIGVDYNYYDRLYEQYNVLKYNAGSRIDELPDYSILRANIKYSFDIVGFKANVYANIDNLLDTEYIAESSEYEGTSSTYSFVHMGLGRTWSIGLRVKF